MADVSEIRWHADSSAEKPSFSAFSVASPETVKDASLPSASTLAGADSKPSDFSIVPISDPAKQDDPPPYAEEHPPYVPHAGDFRQYLRDIILGVNDGLVSMFLLILGVAGGGMTNKQILLTGITGAVGGAISMALGEYLATVSQTEVYQNDLKLEKEHFKYHRDIEIAQVHQVLRDDLKLTGEVLEGAVRQIGEDDDAMLRFMQAFEFGITDSEDRNPLIAMGLSFCLFLTGSLPSVIPFACTESHDTALITAGVLCGVALWVVGAVQCISTRGDPLKSGFRNFIMAAAAGAASYGIGALYTSGRGKD